MRKPKFVTLVKPAWLIVTVLSGTACSVSSPRVDVPRSANHQILATEAIDRALDKLEWPDVEGKSVFIRIASPGLPEDERYLQRASELRLAQAGGRVVEDVGEADFVFTVLSGALGVDRTQRFFGVERGTGIFLVSLPEIAIYKYNHDSGYAKVQTALMEKAGGRIVHASGPVGADTHLKRRSILLVWRHRSGDITRFPPEPEQVPYLEITEDEKRAQESRPASENK